MRRPLATRPLDRLTSIRAKLGAVIVFAVGITILIMYVTIGFALRQQQQKAGLSDLQNQANTIVAVERNCPAVMGNEPQFTRKLRKPKCTDS